MTKSLKIKLVAILVSALSIFFAGALMLNQTASVSAAVTPVALESVNSFKMDEGALVKEETDATKTGISFQVRMLTSDYEGLKANAGANVKVGIVVAPDFYVDSDLHELSVANIFGDTAIYYVDDNEIDGEKNGDGRYEIWNISSPLAAVDGDYTVFKGNLVNFVGNDALTCDYVARGYISYTDGNGTEYKMADYAGATADRANNTRSMAIVAKTALDNPDQTFVNKTNFENTYVKPVTYATPIYLDDATAIPVADIFGEAGTVNSIIPFCEDEVALGTNTLSGFTVDGDDTNTRTVYIKTTQGKRFINVIPCTLVVDEKTDLDYFKFNDDTTVLDGYYVLTKDVSYDGDTFEHPDEPWYDGKYGFSGKFDGKGHSISNIKFGPCGFFGKIYNVAEIVNVAFKDVSFTTVEYCSVIAYGFYDADGSVTQKWSGRATMQNIYIQLSSMSTKNNFGVISYSCVNMNSTFTNVVIDTGAATDGEQNISGSLTAMLNYNTDQLATANTNFKDIYVISNVALVRHKNTNKEIDAVNKSTVTDSSNIEGSKLKLVGVKRYTPTEDMTSVSNDLSTFDTKYWDISSGKIPVWVGASAQA